MAKIKYLFDGEQGGVYVRAFKKKRNIVVQVWLNLATRDVTEPSGDWSMPNVLGLAAAIDQAILQTKENR